MNKVTKRTMKNIIMILMLIALGAGAVLTMSFAAESTASSTGTPQSEFSAQQAPPELPDGSSQPPEMPDNDNASAQQTPPDKPDSDTQNGAEEPPEMPNGNDNGNGQQAPPDMPPDMNNASSQKRGGLRTVYYVVFAAESMLAAAILLWLIMSGFNKKGVNETFSGWKRTVIYALSVLIVAGCLTVIQSEATSKCFAESPATQSQTAPPMSESNASVEASGAKTVTGDETLSDSYTSENADESAILVTDGGNATINGATVTKTGDSTNTESSEFNGVNAAILVRSDSVATIKGATINTDAEGANAVFSTGENAKVYISDSTITSTGARSARGLDATYGGYIEADSVNITTQGGSCAALATDRGEGTVKVKNSTLETNGKGSPVIYSTGNISIENTTGTANGSQNIVIEGKNSASVTDSTLTASGAGNRNGVDNAGVMLYQSMSGDASEGTGTLTVTDSTLEIQSASEYYKTAPMFFVTNTDAVINLKNTKLVFGSGTLLNAAATSEWGNSGSNGGNVTLNAEKQTLSGNVVADSISTVNINLSASEYEGAVNGDNTAKEITLRLDKASKITLTGDSYVTSLDNADDTNSNINFNGYKLYVNGKAVNA
ncbi:MAG: hypothetical protein K6C14_01555 [Eubacterium sp.]|nr:hypothetical protein [Eubacterium sp.]